jgi:acetyl-CoA C-acetyltransferase
MSNKSHPIIVGAAQFTQHKHTLDPLDPLNLIAKACKIALNDAGAVNLKDFINSVYMVNINSWSYEDAPEELSKILCLKPGHKVYLPDGGDSPQMLVNRAAKAITSGKSQAILITGGEASYSRYKAKKGKLNLNWPQWKDPKYMEGKLWNGINEFANRYKLKYPSVTYAILETAVRTASGRSLEEHRNYIGKIFEDFSNIASNNAHAWTNCAYSAKEIITPTLSNRYITHPYTKLMCSNVFVDQSSALIMTSEENAEKLKIDTKLWIYPMGGADLKNIFNITQRPKLYNSPAAKEGVHLALGQAGLKLDDIDLFDIYSCFPSIVEIIKNELGIKEDDPRPLSITGGLPFFGGPWSNYSLHAIVSAVYLIRKNPLLKIMVIANGGYNTKQSFGIYGTEPPVLLWGEQNNAEIQQSILAKQLPEPIEQANGKLTIEGYTITYDRTGMPKQGIVIGTLENNRRTIAFINAVPDILIKLEKQELVGQRFPVHYDINLDRNIINLKNWN